MRKNSNPYLAYPSAAAVAVAGHPAVCRKARRVGVGRPGRDELQQPASLSGELGSVVSAGEEAVEGQLDHPSCSNFNPKAPQEQEQRIDGWVEGVGGAAVGATVQAIPEHCSVEAFSSSSRSSRNGSSEGCQCLDVAPCESEQTGERGAVSTGQLQALIEQQLLALQPGAACGVGPLSEGAQCDQGLAALCVLMQQFVDKIGETSTDVRRRSTLIEQSMNCMKLKKCTAAQVLRTLLLITFMQ
jgi:hypothetical protein